MLNVALPDAYVEHGNVSLLREGLGIDSDSIIRKIKNRFFYREPRDGREQALLSSRVI